MVLKNTSGINIWKAEYLERSEVVAMFRHLTSEWQAALDEDSLLDAYACVGLVLADILAGLELTSDELLESLGLALYAELGPAIRESQQAYQNFKQKNQ